MHRDVECRGRFVRQEQLGPTGQSHGNHHALTHAARQFVWVLLQAPGRIADMHHVQHVARAAFNAPALRALMRPDRLEKLGADAHHWVERCHRLLENHRDLSTAHITHCAIGYLRQIAPAEANRALRHAQGHVRQKAHDRKGGNGFARAGLACDAQRLARPNVETHAVDNTPRAFRS